VFFFFFFLNLGKLSNHFYSYKNYKKKKELLKINVKDFIFPLFGEHKED